MTGDRYRLTLTSDGRPVMHGWWGSEAVARSQYNTWKRSWGELPEARIILVDEETGETVVSWPGVVSSRE